ncbi:NAD(P)-dependent oxidoreductase [Streptomyces luteogriseus]|uniref:NAD(P)-dependent oxidoreductase n=1 Tax=Streptomyces luteogriseus TaxID=68233 RepID=UPI0035938E0F
MHGPHRRPRGTGLRYVKQGTRGMADTLVFAAMKPGARLINVGRGGLVEVFLDNLTGTSRASRCATCWTSGADTWPTRRTPP